MHDLITADYKPYDLFETLNIKEDSLLPTIDEIKKQFGKTAITLGSAHLSNDWQMHSNLRSKHYTTQIDELAIVYAN